MISKMLKYQLFVYHKDYEGFMTALREIGVAHIETIKSDIPAQGESLLREIVKLKDTFQFLDKRTVKPDDAESVRTADDVLYEVEQIKERFAEIEKDKRDINRDLQMLAPWGTLPAEQLRLIKQKGIHLFLYSCNISSWNPEWEKEFVIEVINKDKQNIYFAIVSESLVQPEIKAELMQIPERSLSKLEEVQHEISLETRVLNERLDELAGVKQLLLKAIDRKESELEWEAAVHQTEGEGDGRLKLLQIWVPQKKVPEIREFLRSSQAVFLEETPTEKDNVPILLKNDKFNRLFHPIGDLFSLPTYSEMDLTPFFAPFFTLFFGMCLGDVGYGLIILLALTVLRITGKFGEFKGALILGQFLGGSAVIFGLLTGTIFGADLGALEVKWMEDLKFHFLQTDELFNLSLIIGLSQILFGMSIRVVNRWRMYGVLYGLSPLGWILGIIGGGLIIAFSLTTIGYIMLTTGIALILLFSDPSRGIFARLGLGLWDLYGITGLFGDVLSYVRLFALGLSSGILGLVVNNIAFSLIEGGGLIGYFFFVIILVFGHGLNFAISTLSAFVHPIRLTFVEFYKNAGFIGGGKAYQPFGKHYKKSNI